MKLAHEKRIYLEENGIRCACGPARQQKSGFYRYRTGRHPVTTSRLQRPFFIGRQFQDRVDRFIGGRFDKSAGVDDDHLGVSRSIGEKHAKKKGGAHEDNTLHRPTRHSQFDG